VRAHAIRQTGGKIVEAGIVVSRDKLEGVAGADAGPDPTAPLLRGAIGFVAQIAERKIERRP